MKTGDLCRICDDRVIRNMFMDADGVGYEWMHGAGYLATRDHLATHYYREPNA